MVVGHLRGVKEFFALCQFFASQRGEQCFVLFQTIEYGTTFRVDVVAEIGSIYTRISSYLFFVEALDDFECGISREGEFSVACHL